MDKIHNTKTKILAFLHSNKDKEFSIRNIAKEINVDYKTVYLEVKNLAEQDTIKITKIGQTVLCRVNPYIFNIDVYNAEILIRENSFKNKDIKAISNYFKDIKNPFFILLLFGSYASNTQRQGSDIDLMLISDDTIITKKAEGIISLIPLDIHFAHFTTEEFLSMLKTTEFNVGREAFNNRVILSGVENYYKLIQNDRYQK